MRLIATLGATKPKYKHFYIKEDKIFEKNFSFEALKEFYNIDDSNVIIIGTSKTKEDLGEYINKYEFVKVSSEEFSHIFDIFISLIKEGDILDLTQSFRSLSVGAFLSYSFSKNLGKNLKDIFYAQVKDNKNPTNEVCEFKFVSLKKYDNMIELLREINLFLDSYQVLNKKRDNEIFKIHNNLVLISEKLYLNNLSFEDEIEEIISEINKISKIKEYKFLNAHLILLKEELEKIREFLKLKESLRFLKISELAFEKNLLLQSLTLMFEGAVAYLEENVKANYKCVKGNKVFQKNKSNKYKFRNCLKNKITIIRYDKEIEDDVKKAILIKDLDDFAKHLVKVDELRNNSAHAFINKSINKSFRNDIKKELKYFKNLIK